MATVNTGSSVSLDMTQLQLSTLLDENPIHDSTLVRVNDEEEEHFDEFSGTGFQYAAGGQDPIAGTITGFSETAHGGLLVDVTGLSIDAPTLFQALRSGDIGGVINLIFGGDDVVNGGGGFDTLDGWGGNDTILPQLGDDVIRGLEGDDSIDGAAGSDDVNGNKGEDTVHGGADADMVRGGQGNDLVFGDDGDDLHVNGNLGDDTVHGGFGADTVFGGQGADQVFGDDGDDQISGDLGDDTLTGGAGADHFMFRAGSGHDTVTDFSPGAGDRIVLPTGTAFTIVDVGGQAAVDLGAGDQLTLTGVTPASFDSSWVVFA